MSALTDAVSTAFDTAVGISPGSKETPSAANEGPENASTPDSDAPDSTQPTAEATPTPETAPLSTPTPAKPTSPVDLSDLESIKAGVLSDHPELEPVLTARFKEIDRVVNKKLEQLASLRKDAAEQVIRDERLKNIPSEEILGFADLYHTINHGNPQQKEAAANRLFEVSETLRGQSHAPAQNGFTNTDWQNTPEWQQLRNFQYQQNLQQIQQQLESQYTGLKAEYSGQEIPKHQREHVEEVAREKNLAIEDIPMLWRSLYGYEHARQEGIKKGQQLRKEKESLGVGHTTAPPPSPSGGDSKPKNLRDAVASVCDTRGVR